MTVNNPIEWPGPISSHFKSFLLAMLQKDPRGRCPAADLLRRPFIAGVDLSAFGDRVSRYNMRELDVAIRGVFFFSRGRNRRAMIF
jgi:serine/threonine protein kinase